MRKLVGKYKLTVPTPSADEIAKGAVAHPDAGKKLEKAFEYDECESREEAEEVAKSKQLDFLEMVNDYLKNTAKSSAYQAAVLVYRPLEVPVEDIYEKIFRLNIRAGMTEEQAKANIENMKALAAERQA